MIRTLIVLLALTLPVRNHGQYAQSDLGQWFDGLENGDGTNCCSYADGVKIEGPDWHQTGDPAFPDEVYLDGDWIKVPREAIVKATNRVGFAVVWPVVTPGAKTWVRCFMPGTEL